MSKKIENILFILFSLFLFYFFSSNSYLRPATCSQLYKEYISALFVLCMLYVNYFLIIPKCFDNEKYKLFLYLALGSVLLASAAEIGLVYENISSMALQWCASYKDFLTDMVTTCILVTLRNFALLLFFFLLGLYRKEHKENQELQASFSLQAGLICVKQSDGSDKVLITNKIKYIESEGNYAKFHTEGGGFSKKCSLKSLEQILSPSLFCRISRNCIVNMQFVESYSNGLVCLRNSNGIEEKALTVTDKDAVLILTKICQEIPLGNINEEARGNINAEKSQNIVEKETQKTKKSEDFSASDALTKVFYCVKKNPGSKLPDIIQQTNLPKRSVCRYLKNLKDQGIIAYQGSKKTGGYYAFKKKL